MIAARLLSLLAVGGILAWLIGRLMAGLDAGGWLGAAPWFVLILAVAIGYSIAFDRFVRRRR